MANFVTFCEVGEIQPGEREVFDLEDFSVILFNVDGTYYAIQEKCSHANVSLESGTLNDFVIKCPKHGAEFDIRDGRVLALPAVTDIRSFPVRVQGDEVQVDIDG